MVWLNVKIIVDITCLLLVGSIILIFNFAVEPYKRGFFCDDESLKLPYKPDTVPAWSLVFAYIIPALIIILTEFVLSYFDKNKITIPNWVQKVYCHVGVFLFGAAINEILTDIGKYTVGRLRPHFFDVCQLNIDCNNPLYLNRYITTYTCKNTDQAKLKNMRVSFPSGHSSNIMYTMMYFSLYMHSRFTWKGSKLLKHVIQSLAMGIAVFVALSRISDHKHHWSDVLCGSILGITVAIVSALYISKLFPETKNGYAQFSSTESNVFRSTSEIPTSTEQPSLTIKTTSPV